MELKKTKNNPEGTLMVAPADHDQGVTSVEEVIPDYGIQNQQNACRQISLGISGSKGGGKWRKDYGWHVCGEVAIYGQEELG